MTTNKFITKTIIKLVAFVVISIVVAILINSINPIVNNDLAIGQMENSDALFIIYETYNRIIPLMWGIYGVISTVIFCRIGFDIYKFIKIRIMEKKENEKKECN